MAACAAKVERGRRLALIASLEDLELSEAEPSFGPFCPPELLSEELPPTLAEVSRFEQILEPGGVPIIELGDSDEIVHRRGAHVGLDELDLVSRGHPARLQNSEVVPDSATFVEDSLESFPDPRVELATRCPRVSDLQERFPESEHIADAHITLGEAGNGEVLSELTGRKLFAPEILLPVRVVLVRIEMYCLVALA